MGRVQFLGQIGGWVTPKKETLWVATETDFFGEKRMKNVKHNMTHMFLMVGVLMDLPGKQR